MSAFSSGVSVQSTIGSRPIRALLVSHLFYLEENSLRWPINSVDNTKLHCVRSSSCLHILLWHPKEGESTRGNSVRRRDSKLSHQIETNQLVQYGAKTLKSHSIQIEAIQIVCILLMSSKFRFA